MYEEYYGLSACPFRLTPDRRFYFGSEGHRKAMSYLKYGLYQGEGFIVISGDVGTGKSTLVSQLFSELDPEDIVAAQLGTTQVDADDAIRLICAAFGIEAEADDKATLLSAFEEFLVEQNQVGRRVLLVVDEAQNLPMRTLEELRMLSNFNIGGQPLFQSFLIGQPQFMRTLQHPDLAQLLQRIIASYRLKSMSEEETREYILHRLEMVGWQNNPAFTDDSFERIYAETKGVPRRINTLCNRLMLYASLEEAHEIDGAMVSTVVEDLRREVMGDDDDDDAPAQPQAQPKPAPRAANPNTANKQVSSMSNESLSALSQRVDSVEQQLADHDKALRELIDIVVNLVNGEDQAGAA